MQNNEAASKQNVSGIFFDNPPLCVLSSHSLVLLSMWDLTVQSSRSGVLMGHRTTLQSPSFPQAGIISAGAKVARTSLCCFQNRCYKKFSKSAVPDTPRGPSVQLKGWVWDQRDCVKILASSLTSCGTLGKSPDLMSLGFLIGRMGTMWGQQSLPPLIAVGFREHMHTAPNLTHRDDVIMVITTRAM